MPTYSEANLSHYDMIDIVNPGGANGLPAQGAYRTRKMYKEVPYFLDLPAPLRSLYEKLYFGRVDRHQNGILVKCDTAGLKQVTTERQNVFVLNFVADAFADLNAHIQRVADHGYINTDSFYYKLTPLNGLERMNSRLSLVHRRWHANISQYINSNSYTKKKVTNFQSYVLTLLNFMKKGLHTLPLTTSGIVVSNRSSPMISGLSLELAEENYSVDQKKVRSFILDDNFRYFVRAARKYGFYVDRNGPWKITADPFSPPMLDYMLAYGVTEEAFFSTYYDRTYTLDLDHLKTALRAMYNEFVLHNPRVAVEADRGPSATAYCPGAVKTKTQYRERVTEQQLNDLGDLYWLELYFKLRLRESGLTLTVGEDKFRTMRDIYRSVGLQKATQYVNNEVKPYLYNVEINKLPLTTGAKPVRIGSVSDRPTVVVGYGNGNSSDGSSY